MKGSKRALLWIAVGFGVLLLAIQFVPVDRSNPARQTRVPASAEARAVLQRACYDCHSNEVRWPWYGYVAPVSWLVARDVKKGREALNFSTWNLLSADKQAEGFKKSWDKVQQGAMPLWFYLPLHLSAKLSPTDRTVLQSWAASGGAGSSSDPGAEPGATGTGGIGDTGGGSAAEPAPAGTGAGAGIPIDFGVGTGVTNGTDGSAVPGEADGRRKRDHDDDDDDDDDHDD